MSIKNEAINSGKWSALSTFVIVLLQLLQVSIVSRFLAPSSFGLMGMVLVVIGFANNFMDMGISSAIIQRKDPLKKQLSSLYWFNIGAGIIVFTIIFTARSLIADFFQNAELFNVLTWTSIMFLIIPLGQQFQILLQKELKFKELAYINSLGSLVATVATITFAYNDCGVYSLVWGQLISTIVNTVCLVFIGWKNWRPLYHFEKADLKGYLSFGLYQVGERAVTYFNSNLDNIIIGRLLGAEALGYYAIANNLIIIPLTKINPIITRVALPIFSKIQDDSERIKNGYMQVVNILSIINFPVYFGLIIIAPIIVPMLFGPQWTESIILTQILCGVGLLRTIANPMGSLVIAKGRSDLGFFYNSAKTFLQIPVIYTGAHYGGVIGVALAYLILKLFYWFTNYIIIRRLLGPCFRIFVNSLKSAFFLSLIMTLCVWLLGEVLIRFNTLLVLTVEITVGVVVYITLFFVLKPQIYKQLRNRLTAKSDVLKDKSQKKVNTLDRD